MNKIFHGGQLTIKEINNSDKNIFCILEQGLNTCKLVYYIKEKQDNKWILKSIISDNVYGETEINNNSIKVHQVTDNNKINYIINNEPSIEVGEIEDIDELFLKTYKQYE